jgi:hypothetical protein
MVDYISKGNGMTSYILEQIVKDMHCDTCQHYYENMCTKQSLVYNIIYVRKKNYCKLWEMIKNE